MEEQHEFGGPDERGDEQDAGGRGFPVPLGAIALVLVGAVLVARRLRRRRAREVTRELGTGGAKYVNDIER